MNNVVVMGRLTRDPEIRQTAENTPVAGFNLAVDRIKRKNDTENKQAADFPHCIAFGKTAEFCEKFLKQGTKICLRGHIQTGSYTNKDGQTVYTTDIIADQIEFAESKVSGGTQEEAARTPIEEDAQPPFK